MSYTSFSYFVNSLSTNSLDIYNDLITLVIATLTNFKTQIEINITHYLRDWIVYDSLTSASVKMGIGFFLGRLDRSPFFHDQDLLL